MSLTKLIRTDPEVRQRFAAALIKPHIPTSPMLVEPTGKRSNVTGTAFDYLLRFELERRHPHCRPTHHVWVAEQALPRRPKVKAFIQAARACHQRYLQGQSEVMELALICTVLAKLDLVYRAGWIDPHLLTPLTDMAGELAALLAVVPHAALVARQRCLPNPHFGAASSAIGGADADVVLDYRLIDVKTTVQARGTLDEFRQLIGYALLCQLDGLYTQTDEDALRYWPGEITSVGLYYARFGQLHEVELRDVVKPQAWRDLVDWFAHRYALEREEWSEPRPRTRSGMEGWLEADLERFKEQDKMDRVSVSLSNTAQDTA